MDSTTQYDKLSRFVMTESLLDRYEYPKSDSSEPGRCKIPVKDGIRLQVTHGFERSYSCTRCKKSYYVDQVTGVPLLSGCYYHPRGYYERTQVYPCCNRSKSQKECEYNSFHVHRGETLLDNYLGFVETHDKPELDSNKQGIFAVDCEMCYTTHGLTLTRVTVIDFDLFVVYEKLVKPDYPILDYNTKTSGIKEEHLENVTTRLADVQQDLLKLFSSRSILVGHALNHDLKALKLMHRCIIDTAQLYPHRRGLPLRRGLKDIAKEELGWYIQGGVGHDSKEDAVAAMRIVRKKAGLG